MMKAGRTFALISDAGTPLLSDPGFLLVREVIREGLSFTYTPGPSAIVTALVLSGLPVQPFSFFGFLPHATTARAKALAQVALLKGHTVVLFESPERVLGLLREAGETLGDRQAAVCREMTKMHEEVIRGRISEIITNLAQRKQQGEFTIVIAPGEEAPVHMSDETIRIRFEQMLREGMSRKDALKKLAKESGRARNELYNLLMK
jgi:16S rRNA (cytidine1402-2'-O)-methyltransferase